MAKAHLWPCKPLYNGAQQLSVSLDPGCLQAVCRLSLRLPCGHAVYEKGMVRHAVPAPDIMLSREASHGNFTTV